MDLVNFSCKVKPLLWSFSFLKKFYVPIVFSLETRTKTDPTARIRNLKLILHIWLGNRVIVPSDQKKKHFLKAMPPKLILTNFQQQHPVPNPYAPISFGRSCLPEPVRENHEHWIWMWHPTIFNKVCLTIITREIQGFFKKKTRKYKVENFNKILLQKVWKLVANLFATRRARKTRF